MHSLGVSWGSTHIPQQQALMLHALALKHLAL